MVAPPRALMPVCAALPGLEWLILPSATCSHRQIFASIDALLRVKSSAMAQQDAVEGSAVLQDAMSLARTFIVLTGSTPSHGGLSMS